MRDFASPAAFAAYLLELAERLPEHLEQAVDRGGEQVERRAREKFGQYQQAVEPFAAWAELADSTKADRVRRGFSENDPLLRTGHERDQIGRVTRRTARGVETVIGSPSQVLVYLECGTAKMPPRSTLGAAAAELGGQIADDLGATAARLLAGELP